MTYSFDTFLEKGGVTAPEQVKSLGVNGFNTPEGSQPAPEKKEGGYFSRVGSKIKEDVLNRADKVGAIENRPDTGTVEKGVQIFGQGAGAAANAIETTVTEIPGIKQAVEAYGAGVKWLSESAPIKAIGNIIGSSKTLQEITHLYDTDPNFKDTVDGVANIGRLTVDVDAAGKAAETVKNAVKKIQYNTSIKLADAEKGFAPDGTTSNTIKMHDNYIKSGDYTPEKVYADPAAKIYQPDVAKQIVSDGVNNFKEHGFTELGTKYEKMFGDFSNVTPQQILENGKLVLKDANTGIGHALATTKTAIEDSAKAVSEGAGKVVENRTPKLLSIFTAEKESVVKSALENPDLADVGIKGGDTALRNAVKTGAESSAKAKESFIKAYKESFNKLVADTPGKIASRQKILYQFTDDLVKSGAKIKNGKIDFTTSKIAANPGEITKINTAYKALQNWKDFSVKGTNELKQMIGSLTRFPSEAGGSSKSPFLGKYYHYLDDTIKEGLPEAKRAAYADMNAKFSSGIDMYDEMVDAFNSGDPFKKLASVFGDNNDTLRQIVDFYEQTTGNKIKPIVAGRTLAESKPAAFGFLNPRQWIDFFITPETQAGIVTKIGRQMKK